MRVAVPVFLSFILADFARGGEPKSVFAWTTDWKTAQADSTATGKPILAIVNCRQCPDQGKWNEQVVHWVENDASVARDWICFKPGTIRGLDLNIFDFDHDLNWQALFVAAKGQVLGRFGGRDAKTPGKYFSMPGLKYAMAESLVRYQRGELPPLPKPAVFADDFEASQRLPAKACIHCHHVNEFRREAARKAGTWKLEDVWVYPQPENIGLALDKNQGNRVLKVSLGSSAANAGLQSGDILRRIGATPTASVVDVQYALNLAPKEGKLAIAYTRGDKVHQTELTLAPDWRRTDLTWRWSLKQLAPSPQVHGEDLSPEEKSQLGLKTNQLAFRQGNFLTKNARQAGLRINDVILGVDDRLLEMNADEFDLHIRLTYRPGDTVVYQVLRGQDRIKIAVKLSD